MIIETMSQLPTLDIPIIIGFLSAGAALGLGALGSGLGGLFGASEAGNAAKNARRQSQQFFDYAQGFQPNFFSPDVKQQQNLYNQILGQYNPAYQKQAASSLTNRFNKQTEQQRQVLDERLAGRGLLRSGVGAQQQGQFLNEQSRGLQDALLNQNLAFGQQRQSVLGQALGAQQGALGNQANLYQTLLQLAGGQQQAAGQASAQANQAFGQAFGAPFNALAQYGLLSGAGGFGGGGAPGIQPLNYQQQQFGYQQPQYGFQYPGLGQ